MRIYLHHDLKSRIDLVEMLGRNPSDGLIRSIRELVKSVTKISSKLHKPKTFDEVIKNPINGSR